jgi:hypothetical protein
MRYPTMRSIFVPFRGDHEEVIVDRDHGYESDTNAHEIDWNFTRPELEELATDDEREAIMQMLYALSADDWWDDYDG